MENFITLSIETHLFFARIMKEHSLFLEAGFLCKDTTWIKRASFLREQFEDFLRQVVTISNGAVRSCVVTSQELATEFTLSAERKTSQLSGIPIDRSITEMERKWRPGVQAARNNEFVRTINRLNQRGLRLVTDLINFKEGILREVTGCRIFTANYPLLIRHILREARLYRSILLELIQNRTISNASMRKREEFWNQIMMEHALFIRGLLDPSETELIKTADEFANEYKELLEMAKNQNLRTMDDLTRKSLQETLKYREFKTAGTEGILECKIASIILPLLADHILREANHYIRILECDSPGSER